MTTPCLVYITAKDDEQARHIGRHLVESRLAACVNILPHMTSIYRWQGKLEESKEVVVIAKTSRTQSEKLVAAVKRLHSYATPCALVLDIQGGNQEFLDWMMREVT